MPVGVSICDGSIDQLAEQIAVVLIAVVRSQRTGRPYHENGKPLRFRNNPEAGASIGTLIEIAN